MGKMGVCRTCKVSIALSAQTCPSCGETTLPTMTDTGAAVVKGIAFGIAFVAMLPWIIILGVVMVGCTIAIVSPM